MKPLRLAAILAAACTVQHHILTAADPALTGISQNPVQLTITSDLNTSNRIQYLRDATQTNWFTITNRLVTQSPYTFVDPAPDATQRIYRVIQHSTNTQDLTNPTVSITSPTFAPNYATAITPLALSGTASDNVAIASIEWQNTTTANGGVATGTTSWNIPSISLALGVNTLVVTAIDTSGNTATDTIFVTLDNTPPSIAISSPTSGSTHTTSASTTSLGGTASDNVAIASIEWQNTTTVNGGVATGTTSWNIPSISLALGVNTLIVTATDIAGNTATDTLIVTRTSP